MDPNTNEIRPIPNPYTRSERYNCFGCSPDNDAGLKMSFSRSGESVICEWQPHPRFEGYPGVIHGGIQATLADETAAWFIHAVLGTAGVTREMNVTYHHPAKSEDSPFRIDARATELSSRRAVIEVTITGAGGTHFTSARCDYTLFREEVARRRLGFPGAEAFRPE